MRTRSLATVVCLAAVLVLTGCGSGDDKDKASERAGDAFTPGAGTATSSGSAPAATSASDPVFTFPADTKLVFDYTPPADPTQAKILKDYTFFEQSLVAAALTQGKDTRWTDYTTGPARPTAVEYLQTLRRLQDTLIGTERFHSLQVTQLNGKTAQVRTCIDESRFFSRDLKTGKAKVTPVTDRSYYRADMKMALNRDTWQVQERIVLRPAKECKR